MKLLDRILGGGDRTIARARRPEALAASLDQPPKEGVDWLGHDPGPRAPWVYRILIAIGNAILFGLSRLRLHVQGRERLPEGGYIAVCTTHRSWIDPFVLIRALPLEPRIWFMGSGASVFDRRWKERLLRRTGGLLPVWRGGTDISVHVRSASGVVESGAVLALFAEGRIGGPPDASARLSPGAALLCLRTGAPIVPIALCGAEELYRGKRISLQVLAPTDPAELLGEQWQGAAEPGTRAELRQARALTEAIAGRLDEALAVAYPETVDPPEYPRRWRWLTRLLR